MRVVHACWVPASALDAGSVAIWAEDSTVATPVRSGRPPRSAPHPYAVDHAGLLSLLALEPDAGALEVVELQLPTRSAAPLPSPELVRDGEPPRAGAVRTGLWRVPALVLPLDRAYAVLSRLELRTDTGGASVHHLVDLLAFADDLVARGRFLPTVEVEGPYAVWRPVLTGPDTAWARTLALALPPALLAAADPTGRDPLRWWAATLDGLVDAAVRAAAGSRTLTLPRGGTATSRAWLAALTGPLRQFTAEGGSLTELAGSLARWQRDALTGPVRAFFRLSEPSLGAGGDSQREGEGRWQLRFGLQASDEQSLVAEAADVWRAEETLPGLGGGVATPQETFLTELGKAARLYPDLDDALRTARPEALDLDVHGAHRFLREAAPTLATAGFGVQLPGWWSRPAARVGLKVTATPRAQPGAVSTAGGVGLGAIADFRYDVAIGDDSLTDDELSTLAGLKSPLVQLRGQWVELDPRRLEAALRMAGRRGELSVAELLRLGLGLDDVDDDLPVTGVAAEGWLGDLLAGRTPERVEAVGAPADFRGTLRPYQARGLSWLDFLGRAGIGGVLADDMGLGKTVQLLAWLALARSRSAEDQGTTLLICPMSLVGNWQREAERFTPSLRVHVHHGAERARGDAFTAAVAASDLVITTYAIAGRDVATLRRTDWRRVVVDEAQAIKNAATQQATAIRSIPAQVRIAVTGTPVENRLADLWSILEFANPGLLGSATTFKKAYAEPIERHGDDEAAARLRRYTGPFVLRRVKTDRSIITDLPEKLEMEVLTNLTAEQASLYQAVVDDMLAKIDAADGIERRGLVLATMTKLKQVCNHPAHFLRDGSPLPGRSGKLERLDEILTEVLEAGERALLFTQYAEFGALLRGHLAGRFGREVLYLHGGVAKPAREAMVARFQSDQTWAPPLFVLSLKAGGTGLTLTAANHVVHVDRWWNPAVEDQATDRAFRIGQRRNVQVRKLVSAGTVEEKIATMINTKRGLAAKIVGTGESWLTELSTDALADLLRLEAGAVVE